MPYGTDKKLGGDSKENEAWMKECVKSVMGKNPSMSKGSAIAVCKTQLARKKNKVSQAEQDAYRNKLVVLIKSFENSYIVKGMKKDRLPLAAAKAAYEKYLESVDYNPIPHIKVD